MAKKVIVTFTRADFSSVEAWNKFNDTMNMEIDDFFEGDDESNVYVIDRNEDSQT